MQPPSYLPASPITGVDGRLRKGGDRQQYTTLPAGSNPSLSSAAPYWARVVRDGLNTIRRPPQPTFSLREELFQLYELCVATDFSANVAIRSAASSQVISRSCWLRAPPSSTSLQPPNAAIGNDVAFGIRPWARDKPCSGSCAHPHLDHWSPSPCRPSTRHPINQRRKPCFHASRLYHLHRLQNERGRW